MFPDPITSADREADEYELRLHRRSATRGFVLGGLLIALAIPSFVLTGWIKVGLLFIPAAGFLASAWTHREKGNALESHLRSMPYPTTPVDGSARETLGRGSRVLITWTDDGQYPGFVLELRGPQYFVEFDDGRQEWVPSQHVRPERSG